MPTDRSQFLSLAVLSQSVIEALIAFIEDDDWSELATTLQDVIIPLEASRRLSGATCTSRHALTSYEQLRTVAEVWTSQDRQAVIRSLKALLRQGGRGQSKEEARKLIEPFQKLSTQALWNFDQPGSTVPRGVMDLCRVP